MYGVLMKQQQQIRWCSIINIGLHFSVHRIAVHHLDHVQVHPARHHRLVRAHHRHRAMIIVAISASQPTAAEVALLLIKMVRMFNIWTPLLTLHNQNKTKLNLNIQPKISISQIQKNDQSRKIEDAEVQKEIQRSQKINRILVHLIHAADPGLCEKSVNVHQHPKQLVHNESILVVLLAMLPRNMYTRFSVIMVNILKFSMQYLLYFFLILFIMSKNHKIIFLNSEISNKK